jgi:hypothetical protein
MLWAAAACLLACQSPSFSSLLCFCAAFCPALPPLQAFAQVMLLQQETIASLMGMLEAARGEAAATLAPITRPASPLKRRALESEEEAQSRVRQDRWACCLHSSNWCALLWQLETAGRGRLAANGGNLHQALLVPVQSTAVSSTKGRPLAHASNVCAGRA